MRIIHILLLVVCSSSLAAAESPAWFRNINFSGYPMHEAARVDDIEQLEDLVGGRIKRFLGRGSDVNSSFSNEDFQKMTPLHVAIITGNLLSYKFLLDSGADVNALMNFAASPDRRNNRLVAEEGIGMLYLVASFGTVEMVKLLRSAGGGLNVNVRTTLLGDTPVMGAIDFTQFIMARYLLEELGADLSIKDNHNRTVVEKAHGDGAREFFGFESRAEENARTMDDIHNRRLEAERKGSQNWRIGR